MKVHHSLSIGGYIGMHDRSVLSSSLCCSLLVWINIFNHFIYFNYCLSIVCFCCNEKNLPFCVDPFVCSMS